MKRMLLVLAFVAFCVVDLMAQFPRVTIRQIQEVSMDSLIVADGLQNNKPARWTLQKSRRANTPARPGDTVIVTALVVVPAKILTRPLESPLASLAMLALATVIVLGATRALWKLGLRHYGSASS